MMTLYSGTTDPFSQRCRIVLHEKGMDFQIIDVDLDHKPEDLAVMNPYNQVPVLVERDLVLHESNIINEYIDERFPHPELMPADPVMRARARLFLHRFEKELFIHIDALESGNQKHQDRARGMVRDTDLRTLIAGYRPRSAIWRSITMCPSRIERTASAIGSLWSSPSTRTV